MKPLQVTPVKRSYRPGYPQFIEVQNWESLIASSNRRVFQPSTLLFAGLLGSSLLIDARAAEREYPVGPPLKSSNDKAAEIANAALEEVKGSGFWFANSKTERKEVVKGTPAVTFPVIRISFGNSYVGVFDTVRAKKATLGVFAAYGVKLQADYRFKKDGIEFEADGYDPEKRIGFEIVGSDSPPPGFSRAFSKVEKEAAKVLDEKEAAKLMEAVAGGKESLLPPPVTGYPNMDGDQYTPLRAYLQSVLDYLEWLKKEGRL